MEKIACEPVSGYANIIHEYRRGRYGVQQGPIDVFVNSDRGEEHTILPRYDLSLVRPYDPKFHCDDFHYETYKKCCDSVLGQKIINFLRKQKASHLINTYIANCKAEIKPRLEKLANGDTSNLSNFLTRVLRSPLLHDDTELLDQKLVGLTSGEIWRAFQKAGLARKISSIKN